MNTINLNNITEYKSEDLKVMIDALQNELESREDARKEQLCYEIHRAVSMLFNEFPDTKFYIDGYNPDCGIHLTTCLNHLNFTSITDKVEEVKGDDIF